MANAMYVYIHACATAKLESQRTAGSKTQGKGTAAANRTELLLLIYYCRIQETPGAGHAGEYYGGTPKGPEGTETPRGPEAQRGDRERHQEDRREQRGYRSRPQGHMDPTLRP
jgi:hypothetical protein